MQRLGASLSQGTYETGLFGVFITMVKQDGWRLSGGLRLHWLGLSPESFGWWSVDSVQIGEKGLVGLTIQTLAIIVCTQCPVTATAQVRNKMIGLILKQH